MQKVGEQYATNKNLEARMSIYQFAMNPVSLHSWISQQVGPQTKINVLELGCGTGELWKDLGGLLTDCQITLTDLSPGMLARAKENLGNSSFEFQIADFHNLSFADQSFDMVISNHNLYHASDLKKQSQK